MKRESLCPASKKGESKASGAGQGKKAGTARERGMEIGYLKGGGEAAPEVDNNSRGPTGGEGEVSWMFPGRGRSPAAEDN